ncbi:MAG: hypothetical protein EPN22_13480 [Nitrospirae bacterium]|nr:MAG: hypothetical protein EPN22_13480 [Nitrospirota bacterium]
MRIIIISESTYPWLRYIWEQFSSINLLLTKYEFTTYNGSKVLGNLNEGSFLVEYAETQQYSNSFFIPLSNKFATDDYVWVKDDLPVYKGTITHDGDYDLLYNAFVHLSRLEEWKSEKCGNFIGSYSSQHPRKNKVIWRIPVVNHLFNELEKRLKRIFPRVRFDRGTKPVIEFSHDVDYLEKTVQLRLKQTAFDFFNAGKRLIKRDLRGTFSKIKKGIGFAINKSDYWCFDYWERLESEFNIKSVYYFFAMAGVRKRYDLKQWLIDPSYNISNNKRLKEKCKELMGKGNRIGLHGSYNSAMEEDLFIKEKEALENAIAHKVSKTRQHWLNYYESKTPYIHERAGIEEDSTIGFNDISGFRSGVASMYYPYDHGRQRPFSFKVIPLVVMDSHLYDYSNNNDTADLNWLLDNMNKVKKFFVSVNWHQRVISPDYNWADSFSKIAMEYYINERNIQNK